MDKRDSINLKANANFCVKIFRNVSWVPAAVLGASCINTKDFALIAQLNAEEKRERIHNLYEALQLYHASEFSIYDNKQIIENDNIAWELSLNGYSSVTMNAGMCAECSAWLVYMLKGKYDEVGFLTLIGTNLGGHIINYIKSKGNYYFVDMSMQTKMNAKENAMEDGKLETFYQNKEFTNSFFCAPSIQEFVDFYRKFYRRRMKEFFSFYYESDGAIPIGCEKKSENSTILLPNNKGIHLLRPTEFLLIKWKFVDFPDCTEEEEMRI